jgi:two-component sensor histidine kinase
LSLRWREANGPAVKQPTKRGLGSELIERELKNMLRGSAKFNYAPAGLEVVLSIPIDPTIISVPS